MIKSVKRCLKKVLLNSRLTYEELQTVIKEVESIINNRPLVFLYDAVNDVTLTPNKLLFGRNLPVIAPSHEILIEKSLTKRAKYLDTVLKQWWDRWYSDYLIELREFHRFKSRKQSLSPREGDIVLIADEKLKRNDWRVGRITKLIYSQDQNVRSADVMMKSSGNIIRRPINKLFPFVQIEK